MAKQMRVKDAAQDQAPQQSVPEEATPPQLPAVASASAGQGVERVARPADPAPQGVLPVTHVSNLATAISSVMTEIAEQRVVKRGENTFHHYKYATMQDIMQALTPLMAKHGIVVMQSEAPGGRAFLDDGAAVAVTYEFTVFHKSGEIWPQKMTQTGSCNARANNGKFDDKAINKCHTSARKYFLLALFQIPTEDEDDADRGDNDHGPARQSPQRNARRNETRTEAKPPDNVPQKMAPHAIPIEYPNGGGFKKYAVWGGEFIAQINFCETLEDIDQYINLNATTTELMIQSGKAERVIAQIDSAIDDRRAALAG